MTERRVAWAIVIGSPLCALLVALALDPLATAKVVGWFVLTLGAGAAFCGFVWALDRISGD